MSEKRNTEEPAGWKLYLIPGFIIVMGLVVVLAAADVIHTDPADFHAPRLVVGIFGMLFVIAGLVLVFSEFPRIRYALSTLLILDMAVGFGWVALYSLPEKWSGGIPFLSPHANGMIAKSIFGFFTLILIYGFIRMVVNLIRGKIPKIDEK